MFEWLATLVGARIARSTIRFLFGLQPGFSPSANLNNYAQCPVSVPDILRWSTASLQSAGKVTFLALTKPDLAAPGRGVFVTHRERIFSLPQGRQIAIWTPFFKALIPPLVWSRCRG